MKQLGKDKRLKTKIVYFTQGLVMFDDDNSRVYQVEFRNGRYSNETFLIPNEFENDIYTFRLNSTGNIDISAFPDNGDVELNFYRDRNNNRTLDRNDELIDTSNNGDDESIDETVSSGTYFAHVGLDRLDSGERELDYRIDIATDNDNNSGSSSLFTEDVTEYPVEFNRGSYTKESFLIPDEFEHDIYTFELNSRGDVDISVFPDNGEVDLEFYEDSNNNNRLDEDDDLIDRSSGDDESVSESVSSGTYFTHVGLAELDDDEDELDYRLEINTDDDSGSDSLFNDNVNEYEVDFDNNRYRQNSSLIRDEVEHDIYTIELNSRQQLEISASADNGEVDLEFYEDSNNNNRLDEDDDLIDRSSGDDESVSESVSSGTYFTHVGLAELDDDEDELDYRLEINTDDDSGSDSLFDDNVNEYEVDFDGDRYRQNSSLIADEVEHDIYKIELSDTKQLQISAFPDNGDVQLELYKDDNNNGRLDVEDDLIETGDSGDDKEFLTDTVSRGTYFGHVELLDIDRDEDELDYSIEIKTNSGSRSFSLFTQGTSNDPLKSLGGNYNNENFLTNLTDFD